MLSADKLGHSLFDGRCRDSSLRSRRRMLWLRPLRCRCCLLNVLGGGTGMPLADLRAIDLSYVTEVYRQRDLRPSETGGGMAGVLTSGPPAQAASAPAGGHRP